MRHRSRQAALEIDRPYVRRIIRLALLAPDIVEAIVDGREPSGLSLERLVREVPVVWTEQCAVEGPSLLAAETHDASEPVDNVT